MSPTLINYLSQVSTWSGLIKLACALGLFTAAPQMQDQLATTSAQFITAILALVGTIDVLRNERKDSPLRDDVNGSKVPDNKPRA